MKVRFLVQQRIDVRKNDIIDLPEDVAKVIVGSCMATENLTVPSSPTPREPIPEESERIADV